MQSSEESAVQTKHLKDVLVDDLRQLLDEVTRRQIEASEKHSAGLAKELGMAIRGSLAEPMGAISEAVKGSTSQQGEAVQEMLKTLLSAFMEKLDGSMGGQMSGLQDMMVGSVQAMKEMRADFATLIEKMGEASGKASKDAADQVVQLMNQSQERQNQMNAALLEAVREMRNQVSGGQAEIQEQTAQTMAQLRTTLQEMLVEIRRQREESSRSTSQSMAEMQTSLAAAAEQMRKTSEEMGQAGGDQLAKMLAQADERQSALSQSVRQVLEEMATRVAAGNETLQGTTTAALDRVGAAVGGMLDEIQRQRTETSQSSKEELSNVKAVIVEMSETIQKSGAAAAEANNVHARGLLDDVARRQRETDESASQMQLAAREKLQATMDVMASSLTAFFESAKVREDQRAETATAFQQAVAKRTADVLEALDRRIGELASGSDRAVAAMRAAIDSLNGATGQAIDKMGRGADTMRQSADSFSKAGDRLEGVASKTGELLDRVVSASTSLDISVRAVESVVSSYNATRDTLQALSATLQNLVQDADARAGVGRELVGTMQSVVSDFGRVQMETKDYLSKVSGVLNNGFETFANAIDKSTQAGNDRFVKQMSEAVNLISGQVEDLDDVLGKFTRKHKELV